MVVLTFRARPIRRPVAIVASAQRDTLQAVLSAVVRWLTPQPRPPSIPDWLRQDLGLEDAPLPKDWRGVPYHPIDPTVLHGWKR